VTTDIEAKVDAYIRSIDQADAELAATVWATTADISFIHPQGHERGWDEIAANLYGATLGETFSNRTLRRNGALAIRNYGDVAVAELDWDFRAVRRDNRETLHATGRESQVFIRQGYQDWRLVHVHSSGPPSAGRGV
jgi:hypothetical protein